MVKFLNSISEIEFFEMQFFKDKTSKIIISGVVLQLKNSMYNYMIWFWDNNLHWIQFKV